MQSSNFVTGHNLHEIWHEIDNHASNAKHKAKGYHPLFSASPAAKVVVIGQAPGRKAQEAGVPWQDVSGSTLRDWMGVSDEVFYDPNQVSLLPMDFYYPGKAKTGDLPPRKDFADMWHKRILAEMPDIRLVLLVGSYSQKYYLGSRNKRNLTETVRAFEEYLPEYLPIVHPSPLTARWQTKNPWFASDVLPRLKKRVAEVLS